MELSFEPPDRDAFPALALAYDAARRGGAAPAWLSAANEVAVEAFLADRVHWSAIIPTVAAVMDLYVDDPLSSLDDLMDNDANARRLAHGILKK
jgi:1-deoxy-D-xylulose-5-phosphate reductoisomerase